jgi:hypothetical protein
MIVFITRSCGLDLKRIKLNIFTLIPAKCRGRDETPQDRGYDRVLLAQGYHTSHVKVIDEYGAVGD